MKGRQNSSADMLQRKRQAHTLGPTNSLHLKHAKCGDTTALQWWKSLTSVQVIVDTLWTLALPTSSMLLESVRMEFSPGKKEKKAHSFWQNPREEITVKEAYRILPGGRKSPLQKRGRQTKEKKNKQKNPPRIQFVHQLNVPSGWWRRNEQGVPAGVQRLLPSHSLQTITLLSIDQRPVLTVCTVM